MNTILSEMIGTTITNIDVNNKCELIFHAIDGTQFRFEHYQDCCESVQIEDIIGELSDLVDSPLIEAEECSSIDEPAPTSIRDFESSTWTFYRFATAKGTVTIRWLGVSNGYYSESVNYSVIKPKEQS